MRKRNDPDDAPIDGDYTRDVVLNKDPDKDYAFVSVEDLPVMRGRGYVRTERSEDGDGARWESSGAEFTSVQCTQGYVWAIGCGPGF